MTDCIYVLTPLHFSATLFAFVHFHVRHRLQSFLLKVVQPKEDDHSSIVKSVPCAAGSSTELCMVEVRVPVICMDPIQSHNLYMW